MGLFDNIKNVLKNGVNSLFSNEEEKQNKIEKEEKRRNKIRKIINQKANDKEMFISILRKLNKKYQDEYVDLYNDYKQKSESIFGIIYTKEKNQLEEKLEENLYLQYELYEYVNEFINFFDEDDYLPNEAFGIFDSIVLGGALTDDKKSDLEDLIYDKYGSQICDLKNVENMELKINILKKDLEYLIPSNVKKSKKPLGDPISSQVISECPRCKSFINGKVSFCPHCGYQIDRSIRNNSPKEEESGTSKLKIKRERFIGEEEINDYWLTVKINKKEYDLDVEQSISVELDKGDYTTTFIGPEEKHDLEYSLHLKKDTYLEVVLMKDCVSVKKIDI